MTANLWRMAHPDVPFTIACRLTLIHDEAQRDQDTADLLDAMERWNITLDMVGDRLTLPTGIRVRYETVAINAEGWIARLEEESFSTLDNAQKRADHSKRLLLSKGWRASGEANRPDRAS